MSKLLIAAAHKSSGKTTFAMGLCAALSAGGMKVQPFKKGPDYIDPAWLGEAAGRACINLDFYTMSRAEIYTKFVRYAQSADICVVEGNKGLYDGMAADGSDCNAALAEHLALPVLLLIDCQGITRGIAPLLHGYQAFARGFSIIGVVLNKICSRRHEQKLRAAIERYSRLPVLGAIYRDPALQVPERHLGLVPSHEHNSARATIQNIVDSLRNQVDLDRILELLEPFKVQSDGAAELAKPSAVKTDVRIGIARDSAFGFYYPDDLDQLRAVGAELVEFRPTQDTALPEVDALFIGGGFPETHLDQLEQNTGLKRDIRHFVERGKPVYAECGGLMYLARSIRWNDRKAAMSGALPLEVAMHERPQGRGYVRLVETNRFPWPKSKGTGQGGEIPAHEFHYSRVERIEGEVDFAYHVRRGAGIDGKRDGLLYANVLASYAHQRHTERNPWASRFVQYVRANS